MASPLSIIANATLVFQVPTGAMGTDSLGNPRPETEPQTVSAYLKNDRRPRHLYYPGADESQVPMVGYLVEPQTVPDTLKHGAVALCTIAEQQGDFELHLPAPSIDLVRQELGDKIYGLFKRR